MTVLLSSESVSPGHPDKICDQISDAFLDAILAQDKNARVAVETLVKTGMVLLAGEVSTHAWVDAEALVREVLHDIGYENNIYGFSANHVAVLNALTQQSPDIARGLAQKNPKLQGAGDQGIMFGYATSECGNFMPAPIALAHKLMQAQAEAFQHSKLPLGPDAKAQVAVIYEQGVPTAIHNIVFSTQHLPEISQSDLEEAVIETLIKPNIPPGLITASTRFYINPTGRFVLGGPAADCGLTGRKIIVDSYGGLGRHGGGCFSGKDPSKVDRSGAYAARWVAKHIVASGVAERCEVQLAYAIGRAEPTSVHIDTFGSARISEAELAKRVLTLFDLTPFGIIQALQLLDIAYRPSATFGHFGREGPSFTWETLDPKRIAALQEGLSAPPTRDFIAT